MGSEGQTAGAAAIGARLDRMPITSFHHRLAFIIACGLIVDGVDIYISAGVSGALLSEGFANLSEVGYLAMATTLGLAMGGVITGFLADRFGRLAMLRLTILVIVVGGAATALAPSFEALLLCRLVVALGLGGESVLAFGMLTEFMPARMRGRWLAWVALLASIGLPLSMGLGFFILPYEQGWRWMLAIPAIAGIGVFLLRRLLLESPRWLAGRGRLEEAELIVKKVEESVGTRTRSGSQDRLGIQDHAHLHGREGAHLGATSSAESANNASPPAKTAQFWRRFVVGAAIQLASMAAVYGFVSWLPTFFVASGESVASSALFSTIMLAGAPAGTAAAMLMADLIERKWSVAATGMLAAALGATYAFVQESALLLPAGFLAVAAIYLFATLGAISYTPELFPTAERLRALGSVSALGRAFSFFLPLAVVPLFSALGQPGVVWAVAAVLLLQAIVVMLLGPLTKNRMLENI